MPVRYSSSFVWAGPRVTRSTVRGAVRGVNLALFRLRALSVPRAPLDRGPLRESATIDPATEAQLETTEGLLIYDTPYAARQHEELDYHHDDGEAKYVERPMTEHAAELQGIIAKEVAIGILRS